METLRIHVKTIDGEEIPLPMQQDNPFDTPVAELVKSACETLGNNYTVVAYS